MTTSLSSILIVLCLITIGMWILYYITFVVVGQESKEIFFENCLTVLISAIVFAVPSAFFAALSIYSPSNSDEKNSYEITVNEKSFKTSDFKTKKDGSIEFTADDGTIIRASEYEIRKLPNNKNLNKERTND